MYAINSFELPPTEALMKPKNVSPRPHRNNEAFDCIEDKENMPQSNNKDNIRPCPAELASSPSTSERNFFKPSCNILTSEFDIENAYHPSSARGSSEKISKYTNYIVVESADRRRISRTVLDHDAHKQEFAIEVGRSSHSDEAKVIVSPDSPNTTIMTLKKGQRVKDGMILMLTSQVDRRKQLLLGAQVL